ncbi:TetR/AcrR family transcriptional regulator [Actinophytocola sp. NPDC049390]|uniref:TetR/AcrR family transcriptional regulator n=1 Tax=Actinophytocola sp. NPDC049390 TaxID=3363894 RepID=UPI003790F3C9
MSNAEHRRRADAERNIATIIDVASDLFGRGQSPSMAEVAAAAGVRRATLYGHFPSREELIDAVITHAITHTDEVLTALGLDRDRADVALERLVRTSWPILDRFRRLRTAALAELGAERLRRHHDRTLHHVDQLIRRGQDDGLFRTDLPLDWLVAMFYAVLHAAADEADAGRTSPSTAPDRLARTVLSLVTRQHA